MCRWVGVSGYCSWRKRDVVQPYHKKDGLAVLVRSEPRGLRQAAWGSAGAPAAALERQGRVGVPGVRCAVMRDEIPDGRATGAGRARTTVPGLSSPRFFGGWFIWFRWLLVGGGCRAGGRCLVAGPEVVSCPVGGVHVDG